MLQPTFDGHAIAKQTQKFTTKVNQALKYLRAIEDLPNKVEIEYAIAEAHKKGCVAIAQGHIAPEEADEVLNPELFNITPIPDNKFNSAELGAPVVPHTDLLADFNAINPHLKDDE